jgi:hypothetical protein
MRRRDLATLFLATDRFFPKTLKNLDSERPPSMTNPFVFWPNLFNCDALLCKEGFGLRTSHTLPKNSTKTKSLVGSQMPTSVAATLFLGRHGLLGRHGVVSLVSVEIGQVAPRSDCYQHPQPKAKPIGSEAQWM